MADLAVPSDLSTRLAAALSPAYELQGELQGGGMSRVFLADEVRFRRRVVVKVLAPELAASVQLERFEREVLVAAALQDPHIVPVLSAGEVDGLPYFTMPYVEGASLRARLNERGTSTGALPASEAIAILLDVARALAYAHARGIVHRDIKPENVLLAGDAAVVTDFGIAKAIAASATHTPDARRPAARDAIALTRAGMAIGTPGYMAPEQATGGDVDARADLYAWGVMAYEVLGGAHPFASRETPAQLIAAHIAQTPVPLGRVAPSLPAPLVELVMRCLEKHPETRPRSASELVTTLRSALAETDTAEQGRRSPRRRRARVAASVAGALGVIALGAWLRVPTEMRANVRTLFTRPRAMLRVNRVVVAPFRNETGDPRLAPLGALVADYLGEGLARLGSLQVVDAGTASATGEVVRRIPRFLRSADDRALGEETGAKVVVAGNYYLAGDSIVFRARVVDTETGTIRTALDPVSALASFPSAGITALSSRLVAALRAASDEDATELGGLSPPPSLEAYRAFQQGYQAYLRVDADSAIFLPMRRAMALDSSYGAAAVTLAYFASDRHYYALADSALAYARTMRDRLLPTELAMLDITEALARGDFPAAVDASRRTRIPQLTAQLATLGRRPRLAISALTATDPDRGLNLQIGQFYWTTLAEGYARTGAYDRALDAVHEGTRRVPRLRALQLEVDLAAEQGDDNAVRSALAAHSELRRPQLAQAVRTTTLLRTLGGRDAEGRALAVAWANRFLNDVKPDTLPGWMAPMLADLLAATDRWSEIPPVLDVGVAKGMADSARGIGRPVEFPLFRDELMRRRAIALIHLGRRAEALAIDAEFARRDGARWDRGRSAVSRAAIAAHLGDTDRAIDLLTRGLTEGGIRWSALTQARAVNLAVDPMFLPLSADPRYRALLGPDAADAP
jgi:serine/threonine protein kinase/TolB-like protein/tetratricopeptide (TPR) repeat protein